MEKIDFKKLAAVLGVGVLFLFYFRFKTENTRDMRMEVQAIHNCTNVYGSYCTGSCDAGYYCGGFPSCICIPYPTATPTAIPTPRYVCDTSEPTCFGPYECIYRCDTCTYSDVPYTNTKDGDCYTTDCRPLGQGPCWVFYNIPASSQCGTCPATNVTPPLATLTPWPTGCQPTSCDDVCGMPECSDGCGSVTSCGGTSCSSCTGGAPVTTAPVATPTTSSCSPQCSTDPCRTNLCSDQICVGACGGNCVGALTCTTPVLSDFTIKNADLVTVTKDINNRNNICEAIFDSSTNNRRVVFEVNAYDGDGYANISRVEMTWAGVGYTLSFDNGSGNYALYTKTVDFGVDDNNPNTWPIILKITDSNAKTTGWVNTNREWKVWNCNVPVTGALYDGSAGHACNTTGFTSLADSRLDFNTLLFSNAVAGLGVSAVPVLPNGFNSTTLTWGRTYQSIFNSTLSGTDMLTRMIDTGAVGTGATSCTNLATFDLTESNISAYSLNPQALIDYSFILGQDGWFQVVGAGLKAKNEVRSGVPVTVNPATRALSISKILADNGLVSFSTFTNINGFTDTSGYGLTNNWWINRSTNDPTSYSYQYFYNNLFVNRDMGTTGTDWLSMPSSGVYFVNGNLNITSSYSLAAGDYLLVVVRGAITIDSAVDRIDGIYIADGGITATGTSANQLVINGMLYSKNNIVLSRSYTDKMINNTTPAVVVSYQPGLIFNMPGTVMRVLSGWREE